MTLQIHIASVVMTKSVVTLVHEYYAMLPETSQLQMTESNTVHMYSGITSDRVLDGEFLYTKILEVNLFAFAYRLFHEDFSSIGNVPSSEEKSS